MNLSATAAGSLAVGSVASRRQKRRSSVRSAGSWTRSMKQQGVLVECLLVHDPARVIEQLANGDPLAVRQHAWKPALDRVVEAQPPVGDELQDQVATQVLVWLSRCIGASGHIAARSSRSPHRPLPTSSHEGLRRTRSRPARRALAL